jgi:hypothetical protein
MEVIVAERIQFLFILIRSFRKGVSYGVEEEMTLRCILRKGLESGVAGGGTKLLYNNSN